MSSRNRGYYYSLAKNLDPQAVAACSLKWPKGSRDYWRTEYNRISSRYQSHNIPEEKSNDVAIPKGFIMGDRLRVSTCSECPICTEFMMFGASVHSSQRLVTSQCGHTYHLKCIQQWVRISETCPCCPQSSPMVLDGCMIAGPVFLREKRKEIKIIMKRDELELQADALATLIITTGRETGDDRNANLRAAHSSARRWVRSAPSNAKGNERASILSNLLTKFLLAR